MTDTGIFRLGHQVWQRANITAAAAFLREILAREPDNTRVKALYEGLLDVMEPTRRLLRQQRALATVAAIAKERRQDDRRGGDRRRSNEKRPDPEERRGLTERRSGRDRRRP